METVDIQVRRLIEEAESVHVSAASIWAIAIKARLGRLEADPNELASDIVLVV